jgi:hypothetical protein
MTDFLLDSTASRAGSALLFEINPNGISHALLRFDDASRKTSKTVGWAVG